MKKLILSLFALATLATPSFATHRVAFRTNFIVTRPYVQSFATYGYGGYSQQYVAPIQSYVAPVTDCQQSYSAPVQGYSAPLLSGYTAPLVSGYAGQAFVGGYSSQTLGRYLVSSRFVTRGFVTPVVQRQIVVRQPVVVRRGVGVNVRVPGVNVRFFR